MPSDSSPEMALTGFGSNWFGRLDLIGDVYKRQGHIRDRLNVWVTGNVETGVGGTEIGIRSGNGGNPFESDRLRKGCAEVRIRRAAVANVPTGVDGELHDVR